MDISQEQLKKIADDVHTGMDCYVHKTKGEYIVFPGDDLMMMADDEQLDPWRDDMKKVADNEDEYVKIEPLKSYESYQIMKDFIYSDRIKGTLREKLLNAIEGKGAFRRFDDMVFRYDVRQDWFDFREQAMIDYVKRELNRAEYDEYEDDE